MAISSMPLRAKSLDAPDEARPLAGKVRMETVTLGDVRVVRVTFQPGFRWTEHARPTVGTDLCEVRHRGYVISGRIGVRLADGAEHELAAGDAFDLPPGHDVWVIGDEPYVAVDFSPAERLGHDESGAAYVPPAGHRVLLENERVRMLEVRIKPGESSGLHSHPPYAVYALNAAQVRFSTPDGTRREVQTRPGDVTWSPGGWHTTENIGATDDLGIIVELKQ